MKTAKEVLQEVLSKGLGLKSDKDKNAIKRYEDRIIQAMKLYASQALDKASEVAMIEQEYEDGEIDVDSSFYLPAYDACSVDVWISINKKSILELKKNLK